MRAAFFSLALFLGLAPISAAWPQTYPFEIAKADQLAIGAWRRIVPAEFSRKPWIATFDGVAGPLERLTLHEKIFYYGKVCIPHDCGGNFVAFLIAADGSEASGLLDSRTLAVGNRWFGAPDAEARRLLKKKISE